MSIEIKGAPLPQRPQPPQPRHSHVLYLRDPPDQIQRWPSDPAEERRLQQWRDKLDADYHAYIGQLPLPSFMNPNAPTHYHPRPDLTWPPPPPPLTPEPRYPMLQSTQNEAVPASFRELHATFTAPFASPEWVELVNWRRREGERGRLAEGEYPHLMHYLLWAEGHQANLRGRGSDAYRQWLPTPEQERAATEAQYRRIMAGKRRLLTEAEAMQVAEHREREAKRMRGAEAR